MLIDENILSDNYLSSNYTSSNNDTENSCFNINLTGDIINKYNVIAELGHGSYSIVWLVYCIEDNNFYAMKVQNPEDYDEGIDEIKILKKIKNTEPYLNYLVDNFIETRLLDDGEDGEHEFKFVCSVYNLCCGNLDGFGRKGKYTNGYPIEIVKKIINQVCNGLLSIHNKLNGFHGDIKPDNILLCGINNRDLQLIKLYKKANFLELYQLVKKQYMNEKKTKKISLENKLRIRKKIHQQIIDGMQNVSTSQYDINDKYINDICIKISDFGFFCNLKEQFNESFGTQYYQAPENILLGDCTEKVDVWALGCTLYELVTGQILFEPDSDENGCSDKYHLEMMINLCNEFNKKMITKSKNGSKYFNKKGKLNNIIYDETFNDKFITKIENKLKSFNIHDILLCDLLSRMLNSDPKQRISVIDVLNHDWCKS